MKSSRLRGQKQSWQRMPVLSHEVAFFFFTTTSLEGDRVAPSGAVQFWDQLSPRSRRNDESALTLKKDTTRASRPARARTPKNRPFWVQNTH